MLGGIGLLAAFALTVFEGVKYRLREEQGLDPIWAPGWVVTATEVGISLFLAAVVTLGLIGIGALIKSRGGRQTPTRPSLPPLISGGFSLLAATVCLVVLAYLGVVLGDRGLYADATGTAGYTTPLEIAALSCALVGLVVFIPSFFVSVAIAVHRGRSPATAEQEQQ